jgi:ribosomal protein L37AE/L43A
VFWFKSCQKCKGDLYESRDSFGPFVTCIQCGRYFAGTVSEPQEIDENVFIPEQVRRRKPRRKAA